MTSSDILGIEVGRRVARGVRLDQQRSEITAVTEVPLGDLAVDRDGIIDPPVVCGVVEQILFELGIEDRSVVRVGLTVGPRNSGVGSGPTMASWLEAQAAHLQEALTCAGSLGVAFVPTRSIDAAVKMATGMGLELDRVDLAPVAAARAIGDQVEDLICIGSGRGWQARMRDFEVLEAMENVEVGVEQPLTIIDAEGHSRSIDRYGWVDIAPDLYRSHHLDLGNLAPAVGAAIGVAYESPANLLDGKVVGCEHHRPRPGPAELGRVTVMVGGAAARRAARSDPEPTLRLDVTRALERREVRTAPAPGEARTTGPVPPQDPSRQPRGRAAPQGRTRPVSAPIHPAAPGQPGDLSRFVTPGPQAGSAARPAPAHRPSRAATGGVMAGRRGSEWDDPHVDESDPIKMFSPDTDAAHILGKRDGRFGIWHLLVALGLLAIALALAYLYL